MSANLVLVFKAHRLLYHSTLGWRVIKKKKKTWGFVGTKKLPPAPPGYHASEDGSKSTKRTPIGSPFSCVSGKKSDICIECVVWARGQGIRV